jgi:hypothetical protein
MSRYYQAGITLTRVDAMDSQRRQRPWIKVQLSANAPAQEAAALVKGWKAQRQAAAHLVRAVRLYAALCQGDLSLLEAYFPGLAFIARPATARRPVLAPPTVTLAVHSESEDIHDALDGLGLDGLDFGR